MGVASVKSSSRVEGGKEGARRSRENEGGRQEEVEGRCRREETVQRKIERSK